MSSTPVVHDQAFPDRPVRIIDPFGAGGGVDVIARALARRLAAAWGQPAIVENHPGAGSTAAPALVAHAPPDGYTLLINTSAQAYSAARAGELPYDPLRDFVPVAALTSQPYVLVAGAQSGITTIGELAAAASDRPGEIRFASAGTGTGTHLAVAKLNRDLGIAAVHTPPAATDAITDVIAGTAAGHTTYAMLPIPPAAAYLHDGRLVALGVSTARRSRLLPDVPPWCADLGKPCPHVKPGTTMAQTGRTSPNNALCHHGCINLKRAGAVLCAPPRSHTSLADGECKYDPFSRYGSLEGRYGSLEAGQLLKAPFGVAPMVRRWCAGQDPPDASARQDLRAYWAKSVTATVALGGGNRHMRRDPSRFGRNRDGLEPFGG